MRFLLIALMIALLPLRGWVGDVMATEMASNHAVQSEVAAKLTADHARTAGAEANFDHASAQAEAVSGDADCVGHGAGDSTAAASGHCESCTACQACHTVALSPLAADATPMLSPLAPPHSPVARFASADAALGKKPPIS